MASSSKPFFTCSLCGLTCPYERLSQTFTEPTPQLAAAPGRADHRHAAAAAAPVQHVFMEAVFMVSDPNSARRAPLVLGGHCAACGAVVCCDDGCSLFYGKRFCTPCARKHADLFPAQLHKVLPKVFAPPQPPHQQQQQQPPPRQRGDLDRGMSIAGR